VTEEGIFGAGVIVTVPVPLVETLLATRLAISPGGLEEVVAAVTTRFVALVTPEVTVKEIFVGTFSSVV
jgi:hypothetical protein